VGQVVGGYKAGEAIKVWQGCFHDYIIRDENRLAIIREYVVYNPL
jgi:heme A synthase